MKKALRFCRNFLIFIGWTWFFFVFSNLLIDMIWNFDFLSNRSWQILLNFWNKGGIIKTTSDVLLIFSLLLLPIIWIIGYFQILKLDYLKLFLWPIRFIYSIFDRCALERPKRIVLKNIKSSDKLIEEIKSEIESIKPEKSTGAENLRSTITKKLSEKQNEAK